MWFPLSVIILCVYFIQRGFAAIAGADLIPGLDLGMQVFFTTTGLSVLIGGLLLDNKPAKYLILITSFLGAGAILFVSRAPILFGLLFGFSAAIMKLAPYSVPLKLKDDNDAIRIAPQSAAKNFGAAIFMFLLSYYATGEFFMACLATIFLLMSIIAAFMMPDERIKGWNIKDVISLFKSTKFWSFMFYCFWMVGLYYLVLRDIIPSLTNDMGMTKDFSVLLLGISFVICGILRWVWAWIGEEFGYVMPMVTGTIGLAFAYFSPGFLKLLFFIIFSSPHTPNYWAFAKQNFGKEKLGTVLGLGYVAMYLGAGVLYGTW